MSILQEYLSEILKEFRGASGLAVLFLFASSVHNQNSYLILYTLLGFIFIAVLKGILSRLIANTQSSRIDGQFKEVGDMLLRKRNQKNLPNRIQFLGVMVSGFIILIIEISVIFIGLTKLLDSGIILNPVITLIWMIFIYKFVSGIMEAYTTHSFREFVVKFNRELPGKTFWKPENDQ